MLFPISGIRLKKEKLLQILERHKRGFPDTVSESFFVFVRGKRIDSLKSFWLCMRASIGKYEVSEYSEEGVSV